MAAIHTEEVTTDEKMNFDMDFNSIPKEDSTSDYALTELNLSEKNDQIITQVVTPGPTLNGDSKSDAHHNEKIIETSMDDFSESQPIETSTLSESRCHDLSDLNNKNGKEPSSNSPKSQLTGHSDTLAVDESTNKTISMHHTASDTVEHKDLNLNAKSHEVIDSINNSINEHLSNLELVNGQSDFMESIPSAASNDIELGDFFNESSEAICEALSLNSHPGSDINLNYPKPHEEETITTPSCKPVQPDVKEIRNSQSSAKVPRDREGDEDIQPSAKRIRTYDTSPPAKSISSRLNGEKVDEGSSAVKDENTQSNIAITAYQIKEIIKIVRNISRTNAGKNFRQPVAVLWPSIAENYAAKIPNPMDLSTIEKKLKEEAYRTINDLKADVHLIYNNSVAFNSAENPVSKCAMETRNALFNKFSSIPPEPTPVPKKEKKVVKRSAPVPDPITRAPPPKRPSRDSTAPTPIPPQPSAQPYALDPTTNTPLIRRDPTKGDGGRPKREIHHPKNKDLPYTVRPKNKKHQLELKFCDDVITELQKARYSSISHPFMVPVDPVALGIPNYFAIIKKPMDISTVVKKLKDGEYLNANEFEKDVRQIFINCYKYNPDGNPVRQMGKSFEEIFNNLWNKKDQFLADNSPSAASPSERESEDESEDEDILDGATVTASLMSQKERLLEEQSKLINMMGAKHKDEGLLQMQTDLVDLIQKRVRAAEEQAKKASIKKKAPKTLKKSAPVKKAAPAKKAVAKKKYLGTLEKETISSGLGLLPAQVMATVVEMIKAERPDLLETGDETMELDIDSINDVVLWQIHAMIMKHVPELEGQIRESMSSEIRQPPRSAKPAPKKKNKPMSKHEQERKIEALTNLDSEFARASFGSQEPGMTGVSNDSSSYLDGNTLLEPESSGDEDSDSEEE